MSLWDSLDALKNLNHYLLLIGLIVGAVWGIGLFIIQSRIDTLDEIEKKLSNEKTKNFERKIDSSEVKAKHFESQAESLKLRQIEVTEELGLNKEKLLQQTKDLETLENKTRQRIIPEDKKEIFIQKLMKYSGQQIGLRSDISNKECQNLNNQIWLIFESAKWQVLPRRTMYGAITPLGIDIVFNSEKDREKAILIYNIFKEANLNPHDVRFISDYQYNLELIIGSKE